MLTSRMVLPCDNHPVDNLTSPGLWGTFCRSLCVVYRSLRTREGPLSLFKHFGLLPFIVVVSRREMPRLLSPRRAVRTILRSQPRLLYYHLSLYFSFPLPSFVVCTLTL